MKKARLPADSKSFLVQAFLEKEKWHHGRARMSLTKKIQALDRLREMQKHLPILAGRHARRNKGP